MLRGVAFRDRTALVGTVMRRSDVVSDVFDGDEDPTPGEPGRQPRWTPCRMVDESARRVRVCVGERVTGIGHPLARSLRGGCTGRPGISASPAVGFPRAPGLFGLATRHLLGPQNPPASARGGGHSDGKPSCAGAAHCMPRFRATCQTADARRIQGTVPYRRARDRRSDGVDLRVQYGGRYGMARQVSRPLNPISVRGPGSDAGRVEELSLRTPSMPRSRSMRELAKATVQKGASPSQVATRQNVCAEVSGLDQQAPVGLRLWIAPPQAGYQPPS